MIYSIMSTGYEKDFICQNEYEEPYITIKKKLRKIIWQAFTEGVDSFYVNCEQGIPLWAAEIICELKQDNNIHLHIVAPYEEQCVNWNENLRDRYYAVHQQADTVEFAEKQQSPDSYKFADEIMSKKSDKVYIFDNRTDTIANTYIAKANVIWFNI
ncbi:MAG: DUF1273 family protein [Oscillospiraceae bacterium]|nr:DUF1273 family protein [Oscillospiraceae bacterium]